MSQIEELVAARLTTFAGLIALVEPAMITPVVLPDVPVYPAITYQRVSSVRPAAMGSDTGIVQSRFQVSVWAQGYASAKAVKEQVRLALERWRDTTHGVFDTFIENELDLYQDQVRVFHCPIDVLIHHAEGS